MNNYPEHEKLDRIKSQSLIIGKFLEWLDESGVELCKYNSRVGYVNDFMPIQERLADYFNIDLDCLEEEKEQALEELRKA